MLLISHIESPNIFLFFILKKLKFKFHKIQRFLLKKLTFKKLLSSTLLKKKVEQNKFKTGTNFKRINLCFPSTKTNTSL
jgi:hypothetical protein